MGSEATKCWLCMRDIDQSDDVNIFPFSGIPIHVTCLRRDEDLMLMRGRA